MQWTLTFLKAFLTSNKEKVCNMKRKKENFKIKQVYPRFFWYVCFVCSYEYKKEWMWKIEEIGPDGPIFVCKECCPTENDVRSHIGENGLFYKDRLDKNNPPKPEAPRPRCIKEGKPPRPSETTVKIKPWILDKV